MPSKLSKNVDGGPPTNKYAGGPNKSSGGSGGIPLAIKYLQDGSVPIYWGDNQILDSDTGKYSRPSKMVSQSTLSIPEVVRFIYNYGNGGKDGNSVPTDTQHAETCNGQPIGGGPFQCPEGMPTAGVWIYGNIQYTQLSNPGGAGSYILGMTPLFSYFSGYTQYYQATSSATIVIYGMSNTQAYLQNSGVTPIPFVFYTGPACQYFWQYCVPDVSPNYADLAMWSLPNITVSFCCENPFSPPPPPPPPPPSGPGCGTC